jgi:hypothetical protein
MTPTGIGAVVFVCTLGGALAGIWLRERLPGHHLSDESKDTMKLGVGLIATMTALVLFLIFEMDGAFQGFLEVSADPLRFAHARRNQ